MKKFGKILWVIFDIVIYLVYLFGIIFYFTRPEVTVSGWTISLVLISLLILTLMYEKQTKQIKEFKKSKPLIKLEDDDTIVFINIDDPGDIPIKHFGGVSVTGDGEEDIKK